MKHASIPLFIPHLACKNDCIFCNQKRIAGTVVPPSDPYGFFTSALKNIHKDFTKTDLAFFGGSFTGLEEKDMIFYLDAAARVKKENPSVTGIRLSTRPDYISEKILNTLAMYGVSTIELGAQSMNDDVLKRSNRNHSSADTEKAALMIKNHGFELVLQFMPGLPGDTDETILITAEKIARLKPDAVRIYPCVVIKDTALEDEYFAGNFTPLSTKHAVELCANMVLLFERHNINIIRIGLHSSDLMKNQSVVAGPFHPAFGELVFQRIFYLNALKLISLDPPKENTVLYVAPGNTSKMTGRKKENLILLQKTFRVSFSVNSVTIVSFISVLCYRIIDLPHRYKVISIFLNYLFLWIFKKIFNYTSRYACYSMVGGNIMCYNASRCYMAHCSDSFTWQNDTTGRDCRSFTYFYIMICAWVFLYT